MYIYTYVISLSWYVHMYVCIAGAYFINEKLADKPAQKFPLRYIIK